MNILYTTSSISVRIVFTEKKTYAYCTYHHTSELVYRLQVKLHNNMKLSFLFKG